MRNSRKGFWVWPCAILIAARCLSFGAEPGLHFLGGFSRFVQIQQSPQSAAIQDVAINLLNETKSDELHNDRHFINKISTRRGHKIKAVSWEKITWNDYLGRYFIALICRSQRVVCLSANNVPPKCNKNYGTVPEQKDYCPIFKSCPCAAWSDSTAFSGIFTVLCHTLTIALWCLLSFEGVVALI